MEIFCDLDHKDMGSKGLARIQHLILPLDHTKCIYKFKLNKSYTRGRKSITSTSRLLMVVLGGSESNFGLISIYWHNNYIAILGNDWVLKFLANLFNENFM